jgi:ArsR family transcriptional regulator
MPTAVPSAPVAGDLGRLFRGFADPTRIRILNLLAAGELCVCDLVEMLGVPQPTVSRHLAYLRRAGLVTATRDLRFAYYQLATPTGAVHRSLLKCVRTCFTSLGALARERRAARGRVGSRSPGAT